MKSIAELRELMGETEERMYVGMPMADLFAIFIERMNDHHQWCTECRTKLEQRIFDLEQKHPTKRSTYNHWTDAPRLIRS